MATTEELIAALTTATTALSTAVIAQQLIVADAVDQFADTIDRVANELDNVDNTSDFDKPLSDAAVTALNLKANIDDLVTINGQSIVGGTPLVIERSKTELETLTYENRGNLRTPTLPLASVDDSVVIEGIGLLIFVQSTLEPDDDETCFTAVDPVTSIPFGQWLLNVAAPDLQSAWATDDRNFRDELDEDETSRLTPFFVTK
jgi:hypothetical protein